MIKRYFFLLVIFCILTSAFTESNDTRQVITTDECCNDVFVFDDVKQLEASYWIKELPFSHLGHDDSNIEFNNEFIFLSDLRYLEIETVWTAKYIESTDEYIFDSSLVRIKGEYSYIVNENGDIENDFYIMKILDNKLAVYDKIAECENIYICHDKAM